MLNFRSVNIIFTFLLLLAFGTNLLLTTPWYVYTFILLAWIGALFYGSYFINSQFYLKVICRVETNKKEIALSFDDGPEQPGTGAILDILFKENVEAAFFCIGKNIAGNEALLQRMYSSGHLLGNHSFSHSNLFDLFSSKKMLADLQAMDMAMEKVIGRRPIFFRPPFGVTNPNLRKAVDAGEYITIGWSVRSLDTVIVNEKKLLDRVRQIRPGDIILFHDRSETMLSILPEFIRKLKVQGFQIKRLDKLLNLAPYA